jgi:ADP-heptose:LPS heptosyltransferase
MQNLSGIVDDFSDLADVIDGMDLVISIDTAVAHLAGAMGKKVWLLLPYDCDWRWQTEGDTSIWYPTMRIFRQPKRYDWNSLQDKILTELPDLLRAKS